MIGPKVIGPQNYVEAEYIDQLYQKALFNILRGEEVSPRGRKTREILNHTVVLLDVRNNILISSVRDLNYKFMVAEWLWILAGMNDVASISRYNKNIGKFSDDGEIFQGAYGPRWIRQSAYVAGNLSRDRTSRQAVISIWSENPSSSKDIPCTLTWQFLIRDEKLNMIVNMRSSDGWLGLPYDLFNFSQICNLVAGSFDVEPGFLAMNLGSSHLYEEDWEKAVELVGSDTRTAASPTIRTMPTVPVKQLVRNPEEIEAQLSWPWKMYAKALSSKTKSEALQVLTSYF
jgi:thymidylate synthase